MRVRAVFGLLPVVLLLGSSDADRRIVPLDYAEGQRLERQRDFAHQLARRHVGTPLRGDTLADLVTLQRLLDLRILEPEQTWELQCLGVALGDVMASQLRLQWVVVIDRKGRSRALRPGGSENLVFPVTMISKRVQRGVPVDVQELYDKTAREVEALSPRRGRPISGR